MTRKVQIDHLYKIFGPTPEHALELLDAGTSKEEILDQTGNVVGLNDVSLSVEQGELFVVMGLSGSGKSTLVRCVNRLIAPTQGHIYIDDEDILAADDERLRALRRTKMAMVFQRFALFPHKTVLENVAYGLKVHGMSRDKRRQHAQETLEMVGLSAWANYHPRNLSGGMQQRVQLAKAIALRPALLLLDEPTTGLDVSVQALVLDTLKRMQRETAVTMVIVSHDLGVIRTLADRVVVMRHGCIVEIGLTDQILEDPQAPYTQQLVHAKL